jgi:hypothetical protein
MRVEGPQGRFGDTPQKEKVDQRKRTGSTGSVSAKPPSFIEEIQAAVTDESLEEVNFDVLIADVDTAGRELMAKQDDANLKKYKKVVRRFLLLAVRKAYRVKVIEGRGPNPKLYVHVEKIEAKLDDLAREVLASQKNPLHLLAKIEELRGLLLDLKT